MKFSTTTDIWSYGVVLLEMVLGGASPYPELRKNTEVISKILSGYRTPQPPGCSAELYAIILSCWAAEPDERPSFAQLVATLEGIAGVELHAQGRLDADRSADGGTKADNYAVRGVRAFDAGRSADGGTNANTYLDLGAGAFDGGWSADGDSVESFSC